MAMNPAIRPPDPRRPQVAVTSHQSAPPNGTERKRAEELARATNTPLVQVVDGEIVVEYPGSSENGADTDDR